MSAKPWHAHTPGDRPEGILDDDKIVYTMHRDGDKTVYGPFPAYTMAWGDEGVATITSWRFWTADDDKEGWLQAEREVALAVATGKLVDAGLGLDQASVLAHLPVDKAARKSVPLATGCVDYFPDALAAVAHLSKVGNDQHNPGEPLHWSRGKSDDHDDCLMRHFVERGTIDTDGVRHSTKVAWRALALLQLEIELSRSGS